MKLLFGSRPAVLAMLFVFFLQGCSSGGHSGGNKNRMPIVSASEFSDPVKQAMIENSKFQSNTPIPTGSSIIGVYNPVRDTVLIMFKSGNALGRFFVERGQTSNHSVSNGCYEMYFIYSDDPEALFQGDDVCLSQQSGTITLQESVLGNYGMRRIN